MKKSNWDIILLNIQEAREELEKLEKLIDADEKPDEVELEQSLRHAYHHLNFAWNIRSIKKESYIKLSKTNFEKWGKFPKGLDSS